MKFIKPRVEGSDYSPPSRFDLRKEMEERRLARYFYLECGHITSLEEQFLSEAWRPRKHVWYCEKCWKWKAAKPRPKPEPLPDTPLF